MSTKRKIKWKNVLIFWLSSQFGIPLLISTIAFFKGEDFVKNLQDGLIICLGFLLFFFYWPLLVQLIINHEQNAKGKN